MLDSLPANKAKIFDSAFPSADQAASSFLQACLEFNPTKRLTAAAALRHPFLAQFHNPSAEPECAHALRISVDDNTKYTASDYRERLYKDIARRKKASVAKKPAKQATPTPVASVPDKPTAAEPTK
jgi:mitogen-activated protein kinase 15